MGRPLHVDTGGAAIVSPRGFLLLRVSLGLLVPHVCALVRNLRPLNEDDPRSLARTGTGNGTARLDGGAGRLNEV